MALAHEHLGIIYTPMKDYKKAAYNLKEALTLQKFIGDKFNLAEASESYGLLQIYLRNSNEALELLKQSIEINERLKVTKSTASAYSNMGTTYEDLGQYDKALTYFNKAIQLLTTIKDYRALYYASKRLSSTYEKMGNYDKALENFKLYKNYSDSVYNAVKANVIGGIEAEVNVAKKNYENKQLEIQNKLSKQTQLFLVISLIFAFVVVVGSLWAFSQKRKAHLQLEKINLELNKNQESLEELNAELKETNKEKDKFINILAHDLRSPFFGILGISSLLADSYSTLDEQDIRAYILNLNGSLRNLFELLENLLGWSRYNSNKIKFSPEKVKICGIVNSIINLFKFNIEEKSLRIEIIEPEKCTGFVDKNMFETVMRNFLSNAIKFSKPDGLIEISIVKIDKTLELSVKDNGVGITKENLKRILKNKPFSTLGTNNERGTGLGLELCREFISTNGGTFDISSEPNNGITVKFTIPAIDKTA